MLEREWRDEGGVKRRPANAALPVERPSRRTAAQFRKRHRAMA
jgi:hypothetical protein